MSARVGAQGRRFGPLLAGLGLAGFVGAALAQPATSISGIVSAASSSTDAASGFFRFLLGDFWDHPLSMISGGNSGLFGTLFAIYNAVIFTIGVVWASYGIGSAIVDTANTGEALGKRISTVWLPIRMVTGISGIMPVFGGFSLSQVVLVLMATLGIGAANLMTSAANSPQAAPAKAAPSRRPVPAPTPRRRFDSLRQARAAPGSLHPHENTMILRYLVASAAALLALALSAPAGAQAPTAGGASNLAGRNGFGCAPGTTYQMVNGMARCQQPPATAPTTVSCSGTTMSQGSCSFNFPSSTSGTTAVAGNVTTGYAGTAQATCSNGSWTGASGSCTANPCQATTHTNGSCSFSVPALSSGTSASLTNGTAGYTGSSVASCTAGSLSFSGDSCAGIPVNCSGGTISWGSSCSAPVANTANGASVSVTNSVANFSGNAQFTCNNGSWAGPYTPSCTAQPLPCSAGNVGWGSACAGTLPATASGTGATVTNATAFYTGSATYTCSNGGWSLGSASCMPPSCPATPAASQTITCQAAGYAAGYTGSVTQTRTNTCNASTSYTWSSSAWTTTSNTCVPPQTTNILTGSPLFIPNTTSNWYFGFDFATWDGQYGSSTPGQTNMYVNHTGDTITVKLSFTVPSTCTGSCPPAVQYTTNTSYQGRTTVTGVKSGTTETYTFTVASGKSYGFLITQHSGTSPTISVTTATKTGMTAAQAGLQANMADSTLYDAMASESVLYGLVGDWTDPNYYYDYANSGYIGDYYNCASGPNISRYGNGIMGVATTYGITANDFTGSSQGPGGCQVMPGMPN